MEKRLAALGMIAAVVLLSTWPLAAQGGDDTTDPEVYCKTHGGDEKCITFEGATAGYHGSGNTVASAEGTAAPDNAYYDVFLHVASRKPGTKDQKAVELAAKLASALRAKGFYVKGVDSQADAVGGPGVDFFHPLDKQGAADVAEVVNDTLPNGSKLLTARAQDVKSRAGVLGVWVAAPDGS